ncbi:ABC transporter permease [Raphidocelis subcapitata]|uniref:ABC transporter permease n=1 Tax=Raphidocelis subcapitata TaxID=307507 RepID=A0A2V0P6S6_9CHLO|nr:ABC transporter permease [Raphidocelis subcapitata]|eukprot:GBF92795.1 ABC transporter permease [Raphidocelis subcapitata]
MEAGGMLARIYAGGGPAAAAAGGTANAPFGPDATPGGVLALSPLAVALAAALIAVQALVSLRFRLGLHTQLAVAAVRCVLQLSVLGYILVPIFDANNIWLVGAYCFFMVWVSALEAIGRPSKTFRGLFLNTLVIVAATAALIMSYALIVVMGVTPVWTPQYLIPILGMVLGNTITGISVGLSTIIDELSSGADRVERLLALGATRWEATRAPTSRAVRLAMTPLLNQMSVVGLVSIPGMMTGQILAGTDPSEAARYQMVIMFLLGAAATLGAVASIYAAVLHLVDSCHRLRGDRLMPKANGSGMLAWLGSNLRAAWRACCCCWRGAPPAEGYERLPAGGEGSGHGGGGGSGGNGGSRSVVSGAPQQLQQAAARP